MFGMTTNTVVLLVVYIVHAVGVTATRDARRIHRLRSPGRMASLTRTAPFRVMHREGSAGKSRVISATNDSIGTARGKGHNEKEEERPS